MPPRNNAKRGDIFLCRSVCVRVCVRVCRGPHKYCRGPSEREFVLVLLHRFNANTLANHIIVVIMYNFNKEYTRIVYVNRFNVNPPGESTQFSRKACVRVWIKCCSLGPPEAYRASKPCLRTATTTTTTPTEKIQIRFERFRNICIPKTLCVVCWAPAKSRCSFCDCFK